MWTENTKKTAWTASVVVGGCFLIGSLLPYGFLGKDWGMVWMSVTAPWSFLAESAIGAIVEHECDLADGVHVSPGAILAGRVTLGRGTWIGAGATVVPGITIGAGSLIGAGAVVVDDLPDQVVAYGVPARVRQTTGPG